MMLVVIVLGKPELLDALLCALEEAGIPGATVLESRGMAARLFDHEEELQVVASLRKFLSGGAPRRENRTVFTVVPEDKVAVISKTCRRVTGGFDDPDTGILFALPVAYTEGLGGNS